MDGRGNLELAGASLRASLNLLGNDFAGLLRNSRPWKEAEREAHLWNEPGRDPSTPGMNRAGNLESLGALSGPVWAPVGSSWGSPAHSDPWSEPGQDTHSRKEASHEIPTRGANETGIFPSSG